MVTPDNLARLRQELAEMCLLGYIKAFRLPDDRIVFCPTDLAPLFLQNSPRARDATQQFIKETTGN